MYYAHIRWDDRGAAIASQTVAEHLSGTAALSRAFAEAFGAGDDGELIGLLHDLGKCTAENVQENFRRFCAAVGTDPMRVVLSKQVHEPNVRLVTGADAGKGLWRERDYQSVDAMICNTPNLPLVVFSADCGIILLHDPVHAAVGAVHAGWRGAAQGLVSIALRRMGEVFGTHPADVRAAIGAGIGQCCFETDGDVPQAMRAALGAAAEPYIEQRGAKWHVDLKGINAHWLRADGVEQIDVCAHCTACRPDLYWSHRRMGNARGAQIAMIALR